MCFQWIQSRIKNQFMRENHVRQNTHSHSRLFLCTIKHVWRGAWNFDTKVTKFNTFFHDLQDIHSIQLFTIFFFSQNSLKPPYSKCTSEYGSKVCVVSESFYLLCFLTQKPFFCLFFTGEMPTEPLTRRHLTTQWIDQLVTRDVRTFIFLWGKKRKNNTKKCSSENQKNMNMICLNMTKKFGHPSCPLGAIWDGKLPSSNRKWNLERVKERVR